MINRTLKKRLKHWFYRKTSNLLRSRSHQRFMKMAIILLCFVTAAILALLIYLE